MRAFRSQWKHHPVRMLAIWTAAAIVLGAVAAYGALAIEHAVTLFRSAVDLNDSLMATCFLLSGVALPLASLQFAPQLRRRYPLWHRVNGTVVWLLTVGMLFASLAFLSLVPLEDGVHGGALRLVLWSNAVVSLFLLCQAIAAVFARDFRSHMVWMTAAFASLATAPMLLLDSFLVGQIWLHEHFFRVDLAAVAVVAAQMIVIMGLWLSFIGDRDVRTLPARYHWPGEVSWVLCVLAIVVVVHEVVLVPSGVDAFRAWRLSGDRWSSSATVWGVTVVIAILLLPATWTRALQGKPPRAGLVGATLLTATAAAVMAIDMAPLTRVGAAERSFWLGYAVLLPILLMLSYCVSAGSLRRNAWAVLLCAVLCMPCLLLLLLPLGLAAGASFAESRTAALIVSTGTMLYLGIAFGYGARIRLGWANHRRAALALRGI